MLAGVARRCASMRRAISRACASSLASSAVGVRCSPKRSSTRASHQPGPPVCMAEASRRLRKSYSSGSRAKRATNPTEAIESSTRHERGEPRRTLDEARDREREDRARGALPRARDRRAPLPGEDERGRHHVREQPRERHAQAADEPELVEAAEVGGEERGVRDARSERCGERREPGRPDRGLHGGERPGAVAALLEVAGEQDEPDVDPVPDDDRAEEGGVRVQVPDRELRDTERGERAARGAGCRPAGTAFQVRL